MSIRGSVRTILPSALLAAACANPPATVREIATPAGPGSAEPCIEAGADGRVYLSWIEALGEEGHALRFAVREGAAWSAPRTVATGSDWFVNWADFPSVTALGSGALVAHWLRKTGGEPYAYAVALSFSSDGGATWSTPLTPHDASPTEHGFVSKVPLPGGRVLAIWLDGRQTGGAHGAPGGPMTLRAAIVRTDGTIEREDRIDARVCDCCQTDAVPLDDGSIVVAYRDRSEEEIRDISVARFDGARWDSPRTVHDDGWEMPGCPVNGPAIAARGSLVVVAWFTAAGAPPIPRVRIAFSADAGTTFEAPVDVDAGRPVGRVDVAILESGDAIVTWIESEEGAARILARRVGRDGVRGPSVEVATTSASRAAGFPRTALAGTELLVTWTEAAEPSRIRTAALSAER